MEPEKHYSEVMLSLAREGVAFRIIGTYALKTMLGGFLRDYDLSDADIVLEPSEANIRRFIQAMRQQGWSVRVWGMEVDESVQMDYLKGKFYLRATTGNLIVDATYECPIPWEEMDRDGSDWSGEPMASFEHILDLKQMKGTPEDDELCLTVAWIMACR